MLSIYQYQFLAMGTRCELNLFAQTADIANAAQLSVVADIARLEAKYSRYRADSFLSEINRIAATGGEISVDAETASLLTYADTCHQQSQGLFDVTSGVLRRVWRFDSGKIPSEQQIAAALTHIGWHKLQWQPPLLSFPHPGMEIDFGGIVKEYAADRAAVLCQEQGVLHGYVNLGGDLRVIGPQPDGAPWQIAIEHPRHAKQVVQYLQLYSGGIASSGDYQRCMLINGQRYCHIINPKTGWPVQYMASVTVVGDFCLIAGSASTIAMLLEQQAPDWLQDLGLPYVWMDAAGRIGSN